jgi:hypothetical protein
MCLNLKRKQARTGQRYSKRTRNSTLIINVQLVARHDTHYRNDKTMGHYAHYNNYTILTINNLVRRGKPTLNQQYKSRHVKHEDTKVSPNGSIVISGGSYLGHPVTECKYQTNVHTDIYIPYWKLLYMFLVILPPIIRSVYNCIYSI